LAYKPPLLSVATKSSNYILTFSTIPRLIPAAVLLKTLKVTYWDLDNEPYCRHVDIDVISRSL